MACRIAKVLHERAELARGNCLARKTDDKGLALVRVDIRRHRAKPRHKGMREDEGGGQVHGEAIVPQQFVLLGVITYIAL